MGEDTSRLVGLIGWPVAHSLSPAMHNAAFEALGLGWRYELLPVRPGEVETAIRGLTALGFRGANITVPHKTAVRAAIDALSPEAEAIGAVNTLVIHRDKGGAALIKGHNTDHTGCLAAIRCAGHDVAEERIVVVGAGGAARAAVYGFVQGGAREVVVLARRPEAAEALVEEFTDLGASLRASLLATGALVEAAHSAAVLVNATSVGMAPDVEATIWPDDIPLPSDLLVYDLVYAPRETRLLRHAASCGARTLGGLDMLIEQGARSFSLWTGCEAPIDVMRSACEAEMGRRSM